MTQEVFKCHPGIAAVLSFIFNGLGQIYNGQIRKGLLLIFLSSIGMLGVIFGSILIGFWLFGKVFITGQLITGIALFLLGVILICFLGIYSIVDAYEGAARKCS